jgi:ribosomal protein S18 acetylase RimI-like enzyme
MMQPEDPRLQIHRLCCTTHPAYEELIRIYEDSQPESERKSVADLARMMERPEYLFLAALRDQSVVGFSISICLIGSDAALLEYIAVDRRFRGLGIGKQLFRDTVEFGPLAERTVLIEVDSEKSRSPGRVDRVRRKNFYRGLGCREVEGLSYIMPPVSSATPPPMDLMVYRAELSGTVEKSRIQAWLESCYRQVYQLPRVDYRIASMMEGLPEGVHLI